MPPDTVVLFPGTLALSSRRTIDDHLARPRPHQRPDRDDRLRLDRPGHAAAIVRHFEFDKSRFVVIDPNDDATARFSTSTASAS